MSQTAVAPLDDKTAESTSFTVIAGLIRLIDLMLLALAGALSIRLMTWIDGQTPQGAVLLSCGAGAVAACLGMAREDAYTHANLQSLPTQIRLFIKPVLFGAFCLIACLFVLYDGKMPDRLWPLAWIGMSITLVIGSRFPLSHLVRRWTRDGRLSRKVAIVGLGDFSRDFIERLREEPNAFRIVGIYDDRLSRVPPSQLGVGVMGTVADLLERSRQEKIDVIVVALPLSAVERIKVIMSS